MGSNNSWYVDVDTSDLNMLRAIIDEGRRLEGDVDGDWWDGQCFRRCSQPSKWQPIDLVRDISKTFKDRVFLLECSGERRFTWFFKNGLALDKHLVFPHPRFPNATEWGAAILRKEDEDRKAQEETATREQVKAEEEIAYLKAKLAEKEAELKKKGK